MKQFVPETGSNFCRCSGSLALGNSLIRRMKRNYRTRYPTPVNVVEDLYYRCNVKLSFIIRQSTDMKCERYGPTYHKRVGDLVFSSAPVLKVISLSRALLEGTVAHHRATLIILFTATDAIRFEMDVVQYFARLQHETASRFANCTLHTWMVVSARWPSNYEEYVSTIIR